MDSTTNLERWKSSREPEAWVQKHLQGWNHSDWTELLAMLKTSQFWPMEEAAIGQHLESLRNKINDATPDWARELQAQGYRMVSQEEVERRLRGGK